ncbi:hypothetical protein ACHAW5_002677 [Stephanodiscus triporus]|uniref:Alcohol dehydrogenase N-terminal domain-containing protein n=1 Tax=Stephanodiscus triporus TaxID=2934178 RepID=A0ABD3NDC6_9STRA
MQTAQQPGVSMMPQYHPGGGLGHLIDYGTDDEFLNMLSPTTFVEATRGHGQAMTCNARIGYDHSYHFVLAHIDDHVRFHGARLRRKLASASATKCMITRTTTTTATAATAGRPIKCLAMVTRTTGEPLSLEMGREVRVRVVCNALCHKDVYTLNGLDPLGLFPSILGHVWNTCKVEPNSSMAVFGLRAFGLVVIQGARMASASRIIGVDINPEKFPQPCSKLDVPIQSHIAGKMTLWGVDYSFDCTGNVNVMRAALDVAASGHEICTHPFQLVTGHTWKGTAFGGFKSRTDVPKLVKRFIGGTLPVDHFIMHTFDGVGSTNDAIDALHGLIGHHIGCA